MTDLNKLGNGGQKNPKLEMDELVTDKEKDLEGALKENKVEGSEKEITYKVDEGENEANIENDNYTEDLGILIDQYIQDVEIDCKLGREFARFCEAECGWFEGYPVDIKSFMTCLSSFNEMIRPEYRKYIKIDKKYI